MVEDIVRVRDLDFGRVITSSGLVGVDPAYIRESSRDSVACRSDIAKG
jgi:hypothetical protein